ncbi:hypothetical protein AR457_20655 [Streptomyces agglomeratus]|uniref:DUF6895 family protein n=1 Tax=Streptomyces agglomeratus TaxID=285458 RepID=UPI000854DB34|nr:hypothetical protein [Streptomyces agglomeratus]OEJ39433.1 hypothetical protein BGK70_15995 [Streptomyces agglomeratus]OEJ46182.1 hypothetical protein AR457_20655 [Streptomyces agglomeratus]
MTGDRAARASLLDRMVGDGLAWLDAARADFRLPPDVTTDADPDLTLKPLGELAELTCLISTSHPREDLRRAADGLFAFAWNETRDGELFAELVRGEPHATYPVEIYGVFARAGLRNPAVESLLAATTGLRGWRVAREDHTRTLGVLNAERRIGLEPHARFTAVLELTGLGLMPEPWALDRKGAYGLTHDVFHLTDWGRDPGRLSRAHADYLRLWLPAWLENWLDEELWDLVAELLAVTACLPDAPYDPAVWQRLAGAQAADGSVPDLGTGSASGDRSAYFTSRYHSTLATAFAGTLTRIALDAIGGGEGAPVHESEVAP